MQLFRSRVLLWHSINYSWLFLCYGRSESISRFISSFYSGSCSSNPAFLCVLLITHVWSNGVALCLVGIHLGVEKRICQRGAILPSLFLPRRLLSSWRSLDVMKQILSETPVRFRPPVLQWGLFCWALFPPPFIFCISLVSLKQNPNCFFSPSPTNNSWRCPLFLLQLWHCQANSNIKEICRASQVSSSGKERWDAKVAVVQ